VSGPLHDDELEIGTPLVRALVDRTLPHCAALPLRRLRSAGSSNELFRLGDELLVRLPRQPGGSATIGKEARWLPLIGPLLPAAVPEIVVVGEPGCGYPERWSVVRWLAGDVPTVAEPSAAAEGDRPNRPATARTDSPAANPREISSRSPSESCFAARHRSLGRTPPVNPTYCWIEASERPNRRPITRNDVPARTRRQISSFSATDIRPATTTTPSTRFEEVLRRPPETAGISVCPVVHPVTFA
jgi:hypothetical protein